MVLPTMSKSSSPYFSVSAEVLPMHLAFYPAVTPTDSRTVQNDYLLVSLPSFELLLARPIIMLKGLARASLVEIL